MKRKKTLSSCCTHLRNTTDRGQWSQHASEFKLAFPITSGVRQHSQHSSHLSPSHLQSGRSLSENRSWRPLLSPCIYTSSAKHHFPFTTVTSSYIPAQTRIGARGIRSSSAKKPDEESPLIDKEWLRAFQLEYMIPLKPDLTSIGGLPPLPPIISNTLRTQVFTHRSYAARARHDFELEDGLGEQETDNELLEFQGDAVLGLVVADLVRSTYPRLKVGPTTKIRSLVVSNVTLADISLKYDLPSSIRLQRSQSLTLRASPNIQADTFEAYVGGLYVEQGLDVVRKWAKNLFAPYIEEAYRICREQHITMPSPPPSPTLHDDIASADPSTSSEENGNGNGQTSTFPSQLASGIGHLSFLNQYLAQQKISFEWKYASIHEGGNGMTPTWHAKLKVGDTILATGRGTTKKLAQNDASREALRKMGMLVP